MALVLVLVAVLALGVVLVRRPFPSYSGEIDLPGLDADVTVLRDATASRSCTATRSTT